MVKFKVQADVFEVLPDACFGVVVARGINNRQEDGYIASLLESSIVNLRERIQNINLKEFPPIAVYRNAFTSLGYNPNKFMCSIEALAKRIAKGGNPPRINTAVDLGNAISLQYILPIGAHDVQASADDFEIRFAGKDDTFIPFGENSPQPVDTGELVYARGYCVMTRKWIWRQSGAGMITEKTTDVFYPIDGFNGINDTAVRSARDELADILARKLNCSISTGWVDADKQEFDFT